MAALPQDILDRIRTLERQVRELTGRSQMRPALDKILHGDIVIGEGGRIIAQAANGNRIFATGQTPEGDWAVGMAREDGTAALTVGDDVGTGGQMVRTFSRSGEVIMMDDGFADGYLGRPWVPIPLAPFIQFSNDTDVALYSGQMLTQHKVLRVNLQLSGPSGTAAQVVMKIANQQYGPTWTLSSSATTKDVNERVTLPAADFPHSSDVSVVMWASRTSGSGVCTLRVRGVWGVNTITASEAN
ncbi:hypothetical protein ACFV97_07860 [Streptomyces sp. NPDC059913]|uniref:hypothetical protein n=1 Tax=unclassified Streptomyces TaxID=2593676 RepID=UPI00364E1F64